MPILMSKPQFTFRKSVDFDYSPGKHYIRFLQPFETFVIFDVHWLTSQKALIQCLGKDCPICHNNKIVYAENSGKKGEELAKMGYVRKNQYAYANILDRTEVKVCPNTDCQKEISKDFTDRYPTSCPQCQTLLTSVEPIISNKVKVIRLNRTVVDLMNAKEMSKLDSEGNPILPTSYDWEFLVLPGDKKETAPDPQLTRNDEVAVPADALFDLSMKVMKLSPEEILDVLKGVKIRDIFTVRRGNAESSEQSAEKHELTPEQKQEQARRIAELYAD
jgi:hypothetical protein